MLTREQTAMMKNSQKANELREVGNFHYKASRFFDALVWYNKSICNSVLGSQEMALGFANRSAVYMEIKEYEFCIENINLAIECGYPAEKQKTLNLRLEKCRDMLAILEKDPFDDPWNFFQLSHPPNKAIPFVAKCIKMLYSEKFGRHLVTTKALKTGDIIIIEKPYHKFLHNTARFSHCSNCLKSEKLNLLPCLECNFGKCTL